MGDSTVFHDYDNVHGLENDYQDYAENYLQTALDINKLVADNINISGNSGALYTSVRGEKLYQQFLNTCADNPKLYKILKGFNVSTTEATNDYAKAEAEIAGERGKLENFDDQITESEEAAASQNVTMDDIRKQSMIEHGQTTYNGQPIVPSTPGGEAIITVKDKDGNLVTYKYVFDEDGNVKTVLQGGGESDLWAIVYEKPKTVEESYDEITRKQEWLRERTGAEPVITDQSLDIWVPGSNFDVNEYGAYATYLASMFVSDVASNNTVLNWTSFFIPGGLMSTQGIRNNMQLQAAQSLISDYNEGVQSFKEYYNTEVVNSQRYKDLPVTEQRNLDTFVNNISSASNAANMRFDAASKIMDRYNHPFTIPNVKADGILSSSSHLIPNNAIDNNIMLQNLNTALNSLPSPVELQNELSAYFDPSELTMFNIAVQPNSNVYGPTIPFDPMRSTNVDERKK